MDIPTKHRCVIGISIAVIALNMLYLLGVQDSASPLHSVRRPFEFIVTKFDAPARVGYASASVQTTPEVAHRVTESQMRELLSYFVHTHDALQSPLVLSFSVECTTAIPDTLPWAIAKINWATEPPRIQVHFWRDPLSLPNDK